MPSYERAKYIELEKRFTRQKFLEIFHYSLRSLVLIRIINN